MPRIPEEAIREVLAANPIEDVVGQYVTLRPDGRNLKALCPFHAEKTPSFKVHPGKQIYRCYGCGESGNAVSFVMAMEKVDFPAAMRMLAQRAGIRLPTEDAAAASIAEQARRANELACEFYRRELDAPGFGEKARAYLARRGFGRETIDLFRLGAAPESWDALANYLARQRIPDEAMVEAGLVRPRKQGGGFYDYFRGRVMFPIVDAQGRIAGFGARTLGDDEPKYLNSPETRFFHKGRLLYGAHLALEALRAGRRAILVEGYTDVIMAVAHGVEGVMACLGTALTRDNARELRRYTDGVILLYDGDEAGVRAAERALGSLLGQGLDVRVAVLPGGLDPCDFIVERGVEAFRAALDAAQEAIRFLVDRAVAVEGTGTAAATRRAVARCLAPLEDVDDPLMRELVRKKVADAFGINESAVAAAAPRPRVERSPRSPLPGERSPSAEEVLIAALIAEPSLAGEVPLPEGFQDPLLEPIGRAVERRAGVGLTIPALQAEFAGTPAESRLTEIIGVMADFERLGQLLDWSLIARSSREEIGRRSSRREGDEVKALVEEARQRGDRDEVRRLLSRYQLLARQARGGRPREGEPIGEES